jgi:hypothetical protein
MHTKTVPTETGHPLWFKPPRVYVLAPVWENTLAARRAERICYACPEADIQTITHQDLPDIVKAEGWDIRPHMGELETVLPPIPLLGLYDFNRERAAIRAANLRNAYTGNGHFPWDLAAGTGAFRFFCSAQKTITPNPEHICRPQWRIHQGEGCPHQCAYCGLGKVVISQVNTEEFIEHLAQLVKRNPWQKTWLYDDVMDVLTLEPQMNSVPLLMRFFEKTGDRYLILHTKSDRIEGVLQANAPHNTILAWSLSGPTQSRRLEKLSGTTEGRIKAARQCQAAGLTVRFKFKPIVPVKDWQAEATYTIEQALTSVKPDNLSMTVLMWMEVEKLKRCIEPEMLDPRFLAAAEQEAGNLHKSHVGPFPHPVREKIYRHYLKHIRQHDQDVPVVISTESLAMWQALGRDLGFNPGNYVCGCGAGSTPGLCRLPTNPWQDAKQARTWDNLKAVPDEVN